MGVVTPTESGKFGNDPITNLLRRERRGTYDDLGETILAILLPGGITGFRDAIGDEHENIPLTIVLRAFFKLTGKDGGIT